MQTGKKGGAKTAPLYRVVTSFTSIRETKPYKGCVRYAAQIPIAPEGVEILLTHASGSRKPCLRTGEAGYIHPRAICKYGPDTQITVDTAWHPLQVEFEPPSYYSGEPFTVLVDTQARIAKAAQIYETRVLQGLDANPALALADALVDDLRAMARAYSLDAIVDLEEALHKLSTLWPTHRALWPDWLECMPLRWRVSAAKESWEQSVRRAKQQEKARENQPDMRQRLVSLGDLRLGKQP